VRRLEGSPLARVAYPWRLAATRRAPQDDEVYAAAYPPFPFSSSPICSTETTCSSSAVSRTMTSWVDRPAQRCLWAERLRNPSRCHNGFATSSPSYALICGAK
jgi:hypothetical protein